MRAERSSGVRLLQKAGFCVLTWDEQNQDFSIPVTSNPNELQIKYLDNLCSEANLENSSLSPLKPGLVRCIWGTESIVAFDYVLYILWLFIEHVTDKEVRLIVVDWF